MFLWQVWYNLYIKKNMAKHRKKKLPDKKKKSNERQEEAENTQKTSWSIPFFTRNWGRWNKLGKIYGISMIYHQGSFMWSNEEFFILFGL